MNRRERHARLFHSIALPYSWFFAGQARAYAESFDRGRGRLPDPAGKTALDLGCGTGAFSLALREEGWKVQGIDVAAAMVGQARKRGLECGIGDVLEGLGFPDASFDLVSAAYVAHGLAPEDRPALYRETRRLAKELVLFHDFNSRRSLGVELLEWLERSDYRNFILNGKKEMEAHFARVEVLEVGPQAAWYLCRP